MSVKVWRKYNYVNFMCWGNQGNILRIPPYIWFYTLDLFETLLMFEIATEEEI